MDKQTTIRPPNTKEYSLVIGGYQVTIVGVDITGVFDHAIQDTEEYLAKCKSMPKMNRYDVAMMCGQIEVFFKKRGIGIVDPCSIVGVAQ